MRDLVRKGKLVDHDAGYLQGEPEKAEFVQGASEKLMRARAVDRLGST